MDRPTRHAGSKRPVGHGEPADAGIVGRVDGRPEHRSATTGAQNMAGPPNAYDENQSAATTVVSAAPAVADAGPCTWPRGGPPSLGRSRRAPAKPASGPLDPR